MKVLTDGGRQLTEIVDQPVAVNKLICCYCNSHNTEVRSSRSTCIRSFRWTCLVFAQCRWASLVESSHLRNHTDNEPGTTNYQWMLIGKFQKMRRQSQIFDASRSEKQTPEARTSLYTVLYTNKWVGLMIVCTRRTASFEHALMVLKWLRTMSLAIEGAENVSLQQDKHW